MKCHLWKEKKIRHNMGSSQAFIYIPYWMLLNSSGAVLHAVENPTQTATVKYLYKNR
jgi:hypothetical protein